ncbi:LysR family transcriptional regulator [Yinghuangia sp. YIM S09857]|uniref:LysR family transcriptional regulator n=1 Tax=Yinghuangia sp. YIM S09857 TaxID=3436929 RepID=UPI003F52D887
MDLRQLRYFIAVAEERHLTRAAERLGIRGTSLSQQIIALERSVGVALFRRNPAGMEPTSAALALLPRAASLVDAAELAAQAARDAGKATQRVLRIGVTPGSPPWVVPRLWEAAQSVGARADALDLHFLDLSTARQTELLRHGGLDAALLVLPLGLSELAAVSVGDAALGVLVGDHHPLANRPTVRWTDLDGQGLLWFDRKLAPEYHDDVLAACRAAGWQPTEVRQGPPRAGLFTAELRHRPGLVALRPDWAACDGLRWIPLAGPGVPRVRHALAFAPHEGGSGAATGAEVVSDLVRKAFPHRPEADPRGRTADA